MALMLAIGTTLLLHETNDHLHNTTQLWFNALWGWELAEHYVPFILGFATIWVFSLSNVNNHMLSTINVR